MTADCVGGVWTYALTLCRALSRRGCRIVLAVTGGAMTADQRRQATALGCVWGSAGVTLEHRPLRCEWMQPPLADVPATAAWVRSLIDRHRPDVLHLNDYALAAHDLRGLPRVVVAHSDVVSWHRHVLGHGPGDAWDGYRHSVRAGLDAADAVVGVTAAVLDDLRDGFGFDGGRVIHNAVEVEVSCNDDRPHEVLTVGRIWDDAKNVRLLHQAHRLQSVGVSEGWSVDVAGDATHPDGGMTDLDGMNTLGPLSHDAVLDRMRRTKVYALPARYEPFGLSAAEAAACGCALVLSDIATLREVWGDAATYCDPDDAAAWAAAVDRLLGDDDARHAAADAARQRVVRYDAVCQAAAYHDLYRHVRDRAVLPMPTPHPDPVPVGVTA